MFGQVRRKTFLLPMLVGAIGSATAQSPDPDVEQIRMQFSQSAANFKIQGGLDGQLSLELQSNPILNWSNPERRTSAGGLFLWTLDGLPAVAMAAYPTENQGVDNEFQSLSQGPLIAFAGSESIWNPRDAGISMTPLLNSPVPAHTAAGRMLQMRRLAREFDAKLVPPKRTEIPLRLLATPIYRYPESVTAKNLVDGAMFAFVQGTDPEVLLRIEAVSSVDGEAPWRYGLARMSIVPTEVRHREDLVWQTQWAIQNRSTPYYVYKTQLMQVPALPATE